MTVVEWQRLDLHRSHWHVNLPKPGIMNMSLLVIGIYMSESLHIPRNNLTTGSRVSYSYHKSLGTLTQAHNETGGSLS